MKRTFLSLLCAAALAAGIAAAVPVPVQADREDFVSSVTLFESIGSAEELSRTEADVAVVKISDGGKIAFSDGEQDFSAAAFGDAVPCLYAETQAAAEAAARIIAEQSPYAYIASADPALVALVRESCPAANGMIDLRGKDMTATEIRDTVNKNAAKSALLTLSLSDADEVLALRRLLVTVCFETDSREERYTALSYGADGLLDDAAEANDTLAEQDAKLILPRPLVASHRGNSSARRGDGSPYYENTVAAARAAYENFSVDYVEIDLYLTKDGCPVVMHDSTIDRTTNGSGSVEAMTLEELRHYKVDGGQTGTTVLDEIPTLEDFFKEFADDDLYFLLEIKSPRFACVDEALKVIAEYGMESRVNFISFSAEQLNYARSKKPEISISLLRSLNDLTNEEGSSRPQKVMDIVNPMNASVSADYMTVYAADEVRELNRHGVKVNAWTVNDLGRFVDKGYASVTTDMCELISRQPYEIVPEEEVITVAPGERFRFGATAAAWDENYDKQIGNCTAICIGGGSLSQDDGGYYAEETGEIRCLLLYEGDYYALLSRPVTVRVEEPAGGCGGGIGAGGALFALPLLAAAGIALLKKRKKVG